MGWIKFQTKTRQHEEEMQKTWKAMNDVTQGRVSSIGAMTYFQKNLLWRQVFSNKIFKKWLIHDQVSNDGIFETLIFFWLATFQE